MKYRRGMVVYDKSKQKGEILKLVEHGLHTAIHVAFTNVKTGVVEERIYTTESFGSYLFNNLNDLREVLHKEEEFKIAEQKRQEEQAKIEESARIEFDLLKKEYGLDNCADVGITSPLYIILLKLKSGDSLNDNDVEWLSQKGFNQVLAIHYENEFEKSGDLWYLVKASSALRKADDPIKAIELLKDKSASNNRLMSAILTSYGASLKDIGELDQSEKYANQAVEMLNNSFYPYNLLGSIYFIKGLPEIGLQYFEKAVQLGSDPKLTSDEIRRSLKVAGVDEIRKAVEYLLNKDEKKYKWAEYYLKDK
jgi:hypothetical protein